MKVYFGQIYCEVGASFPFSHLFQRRLSAAVSDLVVPSPMFTTKYGDDWSLMFRISAKRAIKDTEITGPSVFRKDKDVEYSLFLPFTTISQEADVSRGALWFLLDGVSSVLSSLEISTELLEARQSTLIESICSDPAMFTSSENSQ